MAVGVNLINGEHKGKKSGVKNGGLVFDSSAAHGMIALPSEVRGFTCRRINSHGWLGNPTDKYCKAGSGLNTRLSSVGLPSHPWDYYLSFDGEVETTKDTK
jgi:hypothetical protein